MPVKLAADPGQAPIVAPAAPGEFARAFRLPPEDAVRYMQGRDAVRVSYDWHELWHDEHARAFTVSRLARADLLSDLRAMLEKSVAGDLSRRDWHRAVAAGAGRGAVGKPGRDGACQGRGAVCRVRR
ncbi:hypothetical protein Talka_00944 [Tepidimonas alkaliphilus]|uniref:Uncharacterized protein n=1 Tax=Tepidimonas alkaliphilus TaxID=2588942 RepID=A0A554WAK9_9BURK|nr:hypothetical protein [Tepidimonas alkaliphilus]TSE20592.1 hypothetical protein Talka_00944 [Tepidimonas alkaliphilus]